MAICGRWRLTGFDCRDQFGQAGIGPFRSRPVVGRMDRFEDAPAPARVRIDARSDDQPPRPGPVSLRIANAHRQLCWQSCWQAIKHPHHQPARNALTWTFLERTTGFEPATLTLAR